MRPTRTSFSAINKHETCAASYKFSYIDHIDDPSGAAAQRGTRLHTAGELFLKGKLKPEALPVDYWRVKPIMLKLKEAKAKSEETWCVDRDWRKCLPIDEDVMLVKAIIDIHYFEGKDILHVKDLKTGRIYDDHVDQLQLYGLMGLVHYPRAKEVRVSGIYIDQGREFHEATYPRTMMPYLKKHWTERALKVLQDELFTPNPSEDNCKYCNYNKLRKGGPCEAGV